MISELYAIHIGILREQKELDGTTVDVQSGLQSLIKQLGDEALEAEPFFESPMVHDPEADSLQDRGRSISGEPYKKREEDTHTEV